MDKTETGIISKKLCEYAKSYGLALTDGMLRDFEIYAGLLLEWNEKVNLTAITEPEEVAVKHFLDSLMLLKAVDIKQNASLIDVGTGAGFPAVPLKIVRPDLKITLLDSLNKRVSFLTRLSSELLQDNAVIHGRAEQCGHDEKLRESFDFATARGVAGMPVLSEYCLPFVKEGGIFAALKGPEVGPEAEAARQAIQILGGHLEDIKSFELPNQNKRSIVIIKKISQMPPKYPRMSAKIAKKPL